MLGGGRRTSCDWRLRVGANQEEELICEFSQRVAPMLAGIADNERESRTLAALRDTLLPKLIAGELRVQDAATYLERVAA